MFEKYAKKSQKAFYLIFRLLIGVLFFGHGIMKFGFLGGNVATGGSIFWWAGITEIVVGALLFFGLFTRLAALLGAVEMVVAYFYAHFPKGFSPFANGGETALLFFVAFLVLFAYSAGIWNLENKLFKKEVI